MPRQGETPGIMSNKTIESKFHPHKITCQSLRERLDQRFGCRNEAAIEDRVIFANRERLILLDREIPQREMRQGVAQRSIAVAKIGGDDAAIDQWASRDVYPFDCREAQEIRLQMTVKLLERQQSILAAVEIDDMNVQRLALRMEAQKLLGHRFQCAGNM